MSSTTISTGGAPGQPDGEGNEGLSLRAGHLSRRWGAGAAAAVGCRSPDPEERLMGRRGDLATKSRDGAVFELRSGQFSLMVLAIRHLDLLQLQTELSDHVGSAPALLQGATRK